MVQRPKDSGVPARSELILGGQKSGKSRRAEMLAQQWLSAAPGHRALLIATAQAHDAEMRDRIARHQGDRAERVPGMETLEEPRDLAGALLSASNADTLVVVDCLTLWLTHWAMPMEPAAREQRSEADENFAKKQALAQDWSAQAAHFFEVLANTPGPVVLVGNEIGLGVIPMGSQVRAFVDALGVLNQRAADVCDRVTLMVADIALNLKEPG